jgi:Na+/glutamate symporter
MGSAWREQGTGPAVKVDIVGQLHLVVVVALASLRLFGSFRFDAGVLLNLLLVHAVFLLVPAILILLLLLGPDMYCSPRHIMRR